MQITFDHSQESISGGLGIPEERQEQLKEIISNHIKKSLLGEGKIITECIEEIVKGAEVDKPEEFFWVGWLFRQGLDTYRRNQLFSHLIEADSETSEEGM